MSQVEIEMVLVFLSLFLVDQSEVKLGKEDRYRGVLGQGNLRVVFQCLNV